MGRVVSVFVFLVLVVLVVGACRRHVETIPANAACQADSAGNAVNTITLDQRNTKIDVEHDKCYLVRGTSPPQQIVWIVDGLEDDQTLLIERKSVFTKKRFVLERWVATERNMSVGSGFPTKSGVFSYKMRVLDDEGKPVKDFEVDPEAIIRELEPSNSAADGIRTTDG